ncbi:MAG: VWA domain-containing protein [Myxococcales bacterium]|nr:VWA domain-containing protein [Myxococcales bacterium]
MKTQRTHCFFGSHGLTILLLLSACGPTGGDRDPSGIGQEAGGGSGGSGAAAGGVGSVADAGPPPLPVELPDELTGQDESSTCAENVQEAKESPVALFVLLDRSGSMTENGDRWTPVTEAILSFVESPASGGMKVGLQYFPLNGTKKDDPVICQIDNYTSPAVELGALPGNADPMRMSIAANHFTSANSQDPEHSGTPTLAAVQGVLQHLTAWGQAHPDHKLVLLLATDGNPTKACAKNTISEIGKVLKAASEAPKPVNTFVIGIGTVSNLNQLALAGGTGRDAFIVSGGGGEATRKELDVALAEVRSLSLPCRFAIPSSPGKTLDPNRVNVQLQGAGQSSSLGRVESAAACKTDMPAWYYDDPGAPKEVVMCPSACDLLAGQARRVEIVFGCATVDVF